jgi:hypothetical protein
MKSHINVGIEGALAALERGENIWDVPVETIRSELLAAKEAGREFYAGSDCDNFDEFGKCAGHRNGTEPVVYGVRNRMVNRQEWLERDQIRVTCPECTMWCISNPKLEARAKEINPKIVFLCSQCIEEYQLKVEPLPQNL